MRPWRPLKKALTSDLGHNWRHYHSSMPLKLYSMFKLCHGHEQHYYILCNYSTLKHSSIYPCYHLVTQQICKINKLLTCPIQGGTVTYLLCYKRYTLKDKGNYYYFLQGFKKGSRKFRKILGFESKDYDITKLTQVNTMARITNTNVPSIERVKGMYRLWGKPYLNNDLRVFLLKYYNNILGLGNRVAHFVQNAEIRCTFCLLSNKPDPVPESFEHIFYSCPSTQNILKKFFEKFLTPILSAETYFTGSGIDGNEKENVPYSLTLDILRYYIWQCKLNKKLPIFSCIIEDVSYTINVTRKTNMEISD